jgi:hypothetical protein
MSKPLEFTKKPDGSLRSMAVWPSGDCTVDRTIDIHPGCVTLYHRVGDSYPALIILQKDRAIELAQAILSYYGVTDNGQ